MYICFWDGSLEMSVGCFFCTEVLIYGEGAAFDSVFAVRPQENTNTAGSTRAIGDCTERLEAGMFAFGKAKDRLALSITFYFADECIDD